MDFLWSPWRFQYVSTAEQPPGCVFCEAPRRDDESVFILYRGRENFIIMNLFPYTTAHLMIAPYRHIAWLAEAPKTTTDEMMDLAKWCQTVLDEVYQPQGFNIGLNLGRAAGAGVAEHFHLHIVPRWVGDTNFTTVIGETRVLPEALSTSYQKLKQRFDEGPRLRKDHCAGDSSPPVA
jgi:ATP adenylyltransferase